MNALRFPGTPHALAVAMKTNRALRLIQSNMPTVEDDRDTLPPSAPITGMLPPPPEGASTLEEIAKGEDAPAETWAGYDEEKFMHRATAAVINGTNELLKARQIWDIEAIVKRQSVLFQEALEPKFKKTDEAVKALQTELETVKQRLEHEIARLETQIRQVRAIATGQQQ